MSAKCIMIQGTASSVGKSVIAAGLCRIFKQDGFKVAPFKSQNLALNSYITRDGKEMGRAQVVQAEAAGVEPSVLMNPILLKPSGDRIQAVINGEVYGNLSGDDFGSMKARLVDIIRDSYRRLAAEYDIVVIEGAGSPVEVNLKDRDIVNMGMAEIADAPVVLVGDIERGGVFAALAGTMLLFNETERARVKGVIINKFRGNPELLGSGTGMLEDIIKVPVLGVVPYTELAIEDEDIVSDRLAEGSGNAGYSIDIVVVRLPHMSNFTDFSALAAIEGVRLRYAQKPSELGRPDLVLLPGSKSTISDLLHIRRTGMEEEIRKLHRAGAIIFGICGGYQMLGARIEDPYNIESEITNTDGMDLLKVSTVIHREKTTTRVQAVVCDNNTLLKGLNGCRVEGYEIHMGETICAEGSVTFIEKDSMHGAAADQAVGVRNKDGTVYGTYIHGIFDSMDFSLGLVDNLRNLKGLSGLRARNCDFKAFKETQYDRLADVLRASLDMGKIYETAGIQCDLA